MKPLILVIDDSALVRKYLGNVLQKSGICRDVLVAEDGQKGLDVLRRVPVDLVVCDVVMSRVDGFEFLSQKNESPSHDAVPVIMLTSDQALESKIRCLDAGASDYLVKPFHDEELIARAKIHLKIKDLQDQLRIKNEELGRLARLDSLTGLANHHHFLETLKKELSRADRHEAPVALGMVDVDYFKKVNDTHGHQVGDQTLLAIVARLRKSLREHDSLGRYGGEEFGMILVNADSEGAYLAAERCRQSIERSPIQLDEISLPITVSIGVATTSNPSGETVTDLVARADKALYLAKGQGRNRVVLSETSDLDSPIEL
ncbi:MAG: diguanylate cyclase [Acidobacteriota bacterium]|nr:diguanylate cyclase [Acidobacteriota bacterium]